MIQNRQCTDDKIYYEISQGLGGELLLKTSNYESFLTWHAGIFENMTNHAK